MWKFGFKFPMCIKFKKTYFAYLVDPKCLRAFADSSGPDRSIHRHNPICHYKPKKISDTCSRYTLQYTKEMFRPMGFNHAPNCWFTIVIWSDLKSLDLPVIISYGNTFFWSLIDFSIFRLRRIILFISFLWGPHRFYCIFAK